jgi:hypothetical protein
MKCASLNKWIAILLPVSLLWLFVACVSICTREGVEHRNDRVSTATERMAGSDCEGCPLTSFPKAAIREREGNGLDLHTSVVVSGLNDSVQSQIDSLALASLQQRQPFAVPPLKSLPQLQI